MPSHHACSDGVLFALTPSFSKARPARSPSVFSRTLSHALAQWKRRLQKQTCALKIVRRQSSGRSTGLAETSRHSIVHAQTFSSNNVTSPLPPPSLPLLQSNVTPQESSHDCRITSSLYRICTLFCWMFLPNMQSSQSTPPPHTRDKKRRTSATEEALQKKSLHSPSHSFILNQPTPLPFSPPSPSETLIFTSLPTVTHISTGLTLPLPPLPLPPPLPSRFLQHITLFIHFTGYFFLNVFQH